MESLIGALTAASDRIYLLLNGMSGRSWLLDTLIALPVDNDLVKGGPIGACLIYAWHAGGEVQTRRRRRDLLVTFVALLLVITTTKSLGDAIFLPRPFVQSQQMWHLDGDRLEENERLEFRQPLAGTGRSRFEALQRGNVLGNDLVSFPSDHAGFFTALSLGIWFACRRAGLVALIWTLVAILFPRIVTGMHSPLDIAAGAAIGAAIALPLQLTARRWTRGPLDNVAGWTLQHQAISAAFLFLISFEAATALVNVRQLGSSASGIVDRLAGR